MSRVFGRRGAVLAVAMFVVVAGSLLASPVGASAATVTPFGMNLIKNPGAEAGPGRRGGHVKSIPNWLTGPKAAVVKYGSPLFPTKAEARRIHGGQKFFSCGPNTAQTLFQQKVKVKGHNAEILNEQVQVTVKARIATYSTDGDYGELEIDFGVGTHDFQTTPGDPVTATNGKFVKAQFSATLPNYTRWMIVTLNGVRVDGKYCDAYFDNVSVVLTHT